MVVQATIHGSHLNMLGKMNIPETKHKRKNLDELFEEADMLISKVKKGHKELEDYLQKLEGMQKKGVIENFVMYSVAQKAYQLFDEVKREDRKYN